MPGYTERQYISYTTCSIDDYVEMLKHLPVVDVRTPAEFNKGHICGAINIPLFTNEERALVGTLYKQQGKNHAFKKGFGFVASRLKEITQRIKVIVQKSKHEQVLIYCWRGGQRSRSICWLMAQSGIGAYRLDGGYKAYRRYALNYYIDIQRYVIVGGKTGTGKTSILHVLRSKGEQVLDLEKIARHKGSAFGFIDEQEQPTVEQFENDVFDACQSFDERRIWIENESRSIGRVFVPEILWANMKAAPLFHIEMDITRRVNHLVEIYGSSDEELLKAGFFKIKKRLGDLRYKESIEKITSGDLSGAAAEALKYYDKAYNYGLANNTSPLIEIIEGNLLSFEQIADTLIVTANNKNIT